jgi:pSer/pThr/pTyr-binding forkhead associated (FHA) protein
VICITCGRDNPAHLTFCQECGQKLGARSMAPAPMVSLSGPPNVPVVGMEAKPSQPPRPPSLIPQRPPAPEVNFMGVTGQDDEREGMRDERSLRGAADGDERAGLDPPCPLCGHRNPRSLRFCVTCGHLLTPPSLPPPLPLAGSTLPSNRPPPIVPAPAPLPASALPPLPAAPPLEPVPTTIRPPAPDLSSTAQSPIAPVRVVDLGAPTSDAMLRLCPRCRGGSEPSSHYCRFCGASLADAPSIALAPRTPPPAAPTAASGLEAALAATIPSTPIPPPMRPSPTPVRSTVSMVSPLGGATARARLILIARDGGEGPAFPLGEASDIGRTEGNILLGDDRYVSPRHARIQVRSGSFYLRDLASTNGVYVRIPFARDRDAGAPLRKPDAGGPPSLEQPIQDQDLFLVGQQVLKFEVVKHAEEGFGAASENGTLVFGTPTAPRYARLCQRTVEGVVRDVYHLQKAETIIGREVGDLVFTEDPFLSRRHAAIVVQGVAHGSKAQKRFSLMDLGSSNGTFLQLREEIRLKNGDHLRIGQQLFRFDLDRAEA